MAESVAAVVVTHNRKQLLIRALEALLNQERPVDHLFIIDNASTDQTAEALATAGYLKNPVISYIKLNTNTGGAGGFHEGMARAFNAGYTWLWLMDDDGYPAPNCLAKQLLAKDHLDIIGATVVEPESTRKLTWSLICYSQNGYFSIRKRISNFQQLIEYSSNGIYDGYGIFFNAILIHRKVVSSVGLVNKALFIRGDEFEYFLRCRKGKAKIGTQTQAFYYHPFLSLKTDRFKFFYAFRNAFYNYTRYSDVTYPKYIFHIYLLYVFLKFMIQLPSFQVKYIVHVLKAVFLATRGELVPYKGI